MARRRRDIEKRRRLAGEAGPEPVAPVEQAGPRDAFEPEDRFEEEAPPPRQTAPSTKGPGVSVKGVRRLDALAKNKETLLLALLVVYVLLLGLGTVGELFEVGWILNLPLFK